MKKITVFIVVFSAFFAACNNNERGTVDTTDSATVSPNADGQRTDTLSDSLSAPGSATTPISTDSATANFLKSAAEGGLAEVEAGNLAQQKATDEGVKRFASMMVSDHSGANAQVKNLASARAIQLPTETPAVQKQKVTETSNKTGKAFDKAYMDLMVAEHKKTISLFEKAEKESQDNVVKGFITETLPKLKMHLDSAQAIRSKIK